jgi:hypothetical protein
MLVTPLIRKSFGSRLLEHVLARQIEANVIVDYDPDGLCARIVVPLPQERRALPRNRHQRRQVRHDQRRREIGIFVRRAGTSAT